MNTSGRPEVEAPGTRGMTLIEVALALAILLLSVFALAAALGESKVDAVALREVNTANAAMQDKLDEIRAAANNSFQSLMVYNGQTASVPSPTGTSGNMTLGVQVAPQTIQGTTQTALYLVTVTVNWQGVLYKPGAAPDHVQVQEYMTDRNQQ